MLQIVESQADGSVVKVRTRDEAFRASLTDISTNGQLDEVPVEFPLDNISIDSDGNILGAGFPALLKMLDHFKDPAKFHPPTALIKISKNKGKDAFYGQKWTSEVLLEDDGSTVSGFTFVEHDTERGLLFAGGECIYSHRQEYSS